MKDISQHDARGSKWRIWDLHVHTPESFETHYGDWEQFIKDLESLPENIKCIGINDYLFLDGYKKVLDYKNSGRLQNIDLILPIIELRLENLAGSSKTKKINFHVIFSPDDLSPDDIETYFIKQLKLKYTNQEGDSWEAYLTKENLAEYGKKILADTPVEKQQTKKTSFLGFSNATFSRAEIDSLLNSTSFTGKFITAIGKSEWTSHNWKDAASIKKDLINSVDLVFTASDNPEVCNESIENLIKQKVNSKLLHCSDAHHLSDSTNTMRIGQCFTWIKADLTFNGLKYAIEEYNDRVFIGFEPKKLGLINSKPTKYIDSLEVRKISDSSLEEKWFDTKINFNADLVAIIGNKGSGKSALADIIGLLGNSSREQSFSFLTDDRFRERKSKKASHFSATLSWRSGDEVTKLLDSNTEPEKLETVKYIPQNFLETICNEVDNGSETEFDREIKSVIFSHIDESDKLKQPTLDDLIQFKAEETESKISRLKLDLSKINSKIANLERKSSRHSFDQLKEFYENKQRELEAHKKSKPKEVKSPTNSSDSPELIEQKKKLNEKKEAVKKIEEELRLTEKAKKDETIKKAKLEKVLEKISSFKLEYDDFEHTLSKDLNSFKVQLDQILNLNLDTRPLEALLEESIKKINDYNLIISTEVAGSKASTLYGLKREIHASQQKLNGPSRDYQRYLDLLKEWSENELSIIGDEESTGSLKYYGRLLEAYKDYPRQIIEEKKIRISLVLEIWREIDKLASVYKSYYKPVQSYVDKHEMAREKFAFNFSVEKHLGNFSDQFFDWISMRGGAFSGQESARKFLSRLIKESDFETQDGIIRFFTEIMNKFIKTGSNAGEEIAKSLKKDRRLENFYDFLFGLDYLRPKYVLKWGDEELNKLSPGQKGLLLLCFYLVVDQGEQPIVLDQPEENLDNQTVYTMLVPFIKDAKKRRQIFIVTHNPNLAVVCDAEQIIWSEIKVRESNRVIYKTGAIENEDINQRLVDVLEGTYPAFLKRKSKYFKTKNN